jgi:aminopeptidase N
MLGCTRRRQWLVRGLAVVLVLGFATELQAQNPGARGQRQAFAKEGTPKRGERLRTFDVQHIKAELTLDLEKRAVRGKVTHTITPLHPNMTTLDLDCGSALKVAAVVVGAKAEPCKFEHKESTLKITLDHPYSTDETFDLTITYAGSPTRGIYFIKPDASKPQTPVSVWTQGEAEETHDWLPCYDYPNDRATSEMIITVAQPLFVLSNGKLLETQDNGDGTTTYHWKMELPHVSYLISLAAQEFAVYRDQLGSLPVEYYVAKTVDEATVRRSMGKTPKMIQFFSEKIGVEYPYPKYAQCVVPEFTAGGMENISATTLHDMVLIDPVAALEDNSDSVVAHELAHQWFGDLVTCRDWSHIWLNEGFASYFDNLFTEFDQGEDAFRLRMAGEQDAYIHMDDFLYRRPIVEARYEDPNQMFDGITYLKGACILHCLRGQVGDRAWWDGIQRYVREHKLGLVATDDFRKAMETASGQDLGWFFDQWTAKAGHPELKVSWHYEPADQTARVTVEQTQTRDGTTPLFRLPTALALIDESGCRSVPIVIDGAKHEFVIPAPQKPKVVRLDPQGWLIKELTFEKSPAEWIDQLKLAADALGRLEAAEALGKLKGNADAAKALSAAWERESLAVARRDLVHQMANLGAPCRDALLAAAKDRDARVRGAAFRGLANLAKDDKVIALFRAALADHGESYGVRAEALGALAKWKVDDRDALLTAALKTPSAHERIASQALRLLLEGEGPEVRQTAVLYSQFGQPAALRRAAIGALGRLAKDDGAVQDALIALIDDPDRDVRLQVWQHLAALGVQRALDRLEARTKLEEQFARRALTRAIATLKRSPAPATPPPEDNGREIADLERQAADLELQAKELRNRAEALKLKAERAKLGPPAPSPSQKPATP